MINLYHTDCMLFMKDIPDKFYDLAIVDPPYGIDRGKTFGGTNWKVYEKKNWDDRKPPLEYFYELYRVSKDQIIWGANYFPEQLFPSMGWIVWDKGQELTMSDGELAFSSFDRALRILRVNRCYIPQHGGLLHPTQKPVKLYKWLLKNYAKEGDKIFDSHLGSMSIAIACHDMKFDLDGCEIDKDYYEAGVKRFNDHKKQLQMF